MASKVISTLQAFISENKISNILCFHVRGECLKPGSGGKKVLMPRLLYHDIEGCLKNVAPKCLDTFIAKMPLGVHFSSFFLRQAPDRSLFYCGKKTVKLYVRAGLD